jgi:hypothetical protein
MTCCYLKKKVTHKVDALMLQTGEGEQSAH